MRRSYSIAEARATLPSIVNEVVNGDPVEITRRGKAIAVVLSLSQYESLKAGRTTFAESYARFRSAHDLSEVGLDEELVGRDRSAGRRVDL